MILKWGSYAHEDNEITISIQKTAIFSEFKTAVGYSETWDIRGVKQAATTALVGAALQAMINAYSTNGLDLVLYDSDGTTPRHALYSGPSREGVKITDISYPEGAGAEYSTFRTYSFRASADYYGDLGLYSFSESFEFSGGGPQFVIIPTLYGPPIRQDVRQQTPFRCIQSGSSIGIGGHGAASPPAFPADEHIDGRQVRFETPKQGFSMYPLSWMYVFESVGPLGGVPNAYYIPKGHIQPSFPQFRGHIQPNFPG